MNANADFNVNLAKVAQKYFEVLNTLLKNLDLFSINMPGLQTAQELSQQLWKIFLANPVSLMSCNLQYQAKIIEHSLLAKDHKELLVKLHAELFEYYKNLLESSQLPQKDAEYLLFFIKQFLNAIAPDNFILLNEKALQNCIDSNFQTLLQGLDNFKQDLLEAKGIFHISNAAKFDFKLGQNIAATPGSVIYQNDLFELICYQPQQKTHSIPILLVPPCINRYYILDLSPANSFVRWLVENNFQVFLISWVNPLSLEQNFTFEQMVEQGVLEAIKQIQALGYKKINTLGYCIGGTILATSLAYLAEEEVNPVNSATFLNTMLDFSDPGELGIFIRPEIIEQLEALADDKGYLDGIYLYNIFNLLKAKEMIWSYYINNYLQGFTPKAFDILYWNADYVNLPAKMFSFYLRNFYAKNLLIQPQGIELKGRRIDLRKIKAASFFVASKLDHIVPWEQSYKSMLHFGGEKEFVLNSSGHVAGIINPAGSNRYSYFCGANSDLKAQQWLAQSVRSEGSWWPKYLQWLKTKSGRLKKSVDYAKLAKICDAPGRYVFCKA